MHIVFVTSELATANNSSGGLASFTANMARICASNNHKITIILSTVKEEKLAFDEDICLENIFVKKILWNIFDKVAKLCTFRKKEDTIETRRFLVNLYRGIQVRKKIKQIHRVDKIDIVHYCNLGSLAFRARRNIPYVIRISSFAVMWKEASRPNTDIKYDLSKLSIRDKLMDYTLKKARYVISPSQLLADVGKQNLGIEVKVIESPFMLSKTNWNYKLFNTIIGDKKYIIHYGRLGYLKGTHIVARIVKEILSTFPDIYFVLAGSNGEIEDENGSIVRADEAVKRSADVASERVIYVGALMREQLYPFIDNAMLCLLPSRIDNLPNTCIEAMAMGKIVVGTMGASFEQLIDDRVNGFLCERDNPQSYVQAINEALNMKAEEKKTMELKALEVIERFEPQRIYNQYLDFYRKVIREW